MSAYQKIFGTDGVRGRANVEPVTAETALKLGRAAAHVFKNLEEQSRGRGKHKIVIGKDTRLSGYMLENAITSGILSMGVDVLLIGPLPTPGVAYATRSLRADAGIVITASHNPYDDNGIKFFGADGYKLADQIETQIEELVFSGHIQDIRPTAGAIGKAVRIDDASSTTSRRSSIQAWASGEMARTSAVSMTGWTWISVTPGASEEMAENTRSRLPGRQS